MSRSSLEQHLPRAYTRRASESFRETVTLLDELLARLAARARGEDEAWRQVVERLRPPLSGGERGSRRAVEAWLSERLPPRWRPRVWVGLEAIEEGSSLRFVSCLDRRAVFAWGAGDLVGAGSGSGERGVEGTRLVEDLVRSLGGAAGRDVLPLDLRFQAVCLLEGEELALPWSGSRRRGRFFHGSPS